MPLNDFRSVYLPYCLKRNEQGHYAVLNREYKPVGMRTRAWVNYAEAGAYQPITGLTPAKAAALSIQGRDDLDTIHLYTDGTHPLLSPEHMDAYLARLALLAGLGFEDRL